MALFGRDQFLLSQGATKLNRWPFNNPNRVVLSDATYNFLPTKKNQASVPSHVPGVIKNTHFLNAISTRDSCFPRDVSNHNNVVVVETGDTKYVFLDGLADDHSMLQPQVVNVLQQGGLIRIVDVGDGNNRKPSSAEEKLTSYDHQLTKILQTLQLDTGKASAADGNESETPRSRSEGMLEEAKNSKESLSGRGKEEEREEEEKRHGD